MELWIRSQDKERLFKVSTLFVEYNGDVDPTISPYRIVADKCIDLGIYKSKERALEVLDEIQNILKPKYILDSSSIKPNGDSWVENGIVMQNYNANARIEELSTYVYEMPKD